MENNEELNLKRLQEEAASGAHSVVRKGKLLQYVTPRSAELDESVVTVQRYGCFGSNLFPGKINDLQLTAGITSANLRDGKTVVAANLATFFATDTRDDTVLVDLSFRKPRLHHVFGTPASPGIVESLRSGTINVSRTTIKNLWLVPHGFSDFDAMTFDKVVELRDALTTLKRQFRFIVLDLPSALQPDFPTMISNLLDGYVVVVNAGRTTVPEVKAVFQVLNEKKVLGFVMNRTPPPGRRGS